MELTQLSDYAVYDIPVDLIYYDTGFNCRSEFTLQSVSELADSIRDTGRLIHPVLVQPWKKRKGYKYRLIAGHRRFKAVTTFLKATTIAAMVVKGLSERRARMLNLLENLQRKDLSIWEEALSLQRLYPKGVKLRKAAKELKQSCTWVSVRLHLLKMPESVQQKAACGLLSQANLVVLLGLDTEEQTLAAEKIAEARAKGTGKRLPGLPRKYRFRSKYPRAKQEINEMIELMFRRGIEGLPTRVAAWCAGHITDEDLKNDIDAALKVAPERDVYIEEHHD